MIGLQVPVDINYVERFEEKHKEKNFGVNIFTLSDNGEVLPAYKSGFSNRDKMINLLYIAEHYLLISNLIQFSRMPGHKKDYICDYCFSAFTREAALKKHGKYCKSTVSNQILEYPDAGTKESFTSHEKKIPQPIFAVLDFESSLIPVSRMENAIKFDCSSCARGDSLTDCNHATLNIHTHVPTTFSILFVDVHGEILHQSTESSANNLMKKFFSLLNVLEPWLWQQLQRFPQKYDYTQEENQAFFRSRTCYLCSEPLIPGHDTLYGVRDHCHYTNEYIGAAHFNCNLKRRARSKIPIFVHNFKNYDSHFIVKAMENVDKKDISALPLNMEKFRTLTLGKFTFLDSAELLPASLSALVNNLSKSDHPFSFLDKFSFCESDHHKSLLLRKGVFPYEWATSVSKLKNTTELPPQSAFYSCLNQKGISAEDYEHAQNVYTTFNCRHMLDYCELYCCLDTILLLEVIWDFRQTIMQQFGLDSTRYISIPQLSCDCMLSTLAEPIEKMSDPAMILMCEKNIRGGVSFINERHVKLDYEHSETKVQDHLLYTDATNLYSTAQSAFVPVSNYSWCSNAVLEQLMEHILSIPSDNGVGYILCVDLKYPAELHEAHSSLPLAPEQKEITFSELSPYSQNSLIHIQGEQRAKSYKSTKLCSTLSDKKNYVLHYRNLKTYIRLGMKLEKIHYAMRFKQAPVIRHFIELCTEKRKQAKTAAEKNVWKLCMNSNFGKFLQNNRTHFLAKFCTKPRQFNKHYTNNMYKGYRILNNGVVVVYLNKASVKLDRLYAIGFTILETSKDHMFSSYYDFMQPTLGGPGKVSIVLTDTDSLLLHVKQMSRNEMFQKLDPIMDYSNYPSSHPRYSESVKGIPGFFKDENCGNIMTETIGLRAKCYITKVVEETNYTHSTSVVYKGVGKTARDELTLDAYRSCITDFGQVKTFMHVIRSVNHTLYTQVLRKVALSSTDDKRYLLDCGKHTRPHGSLKTTECDCEKI